MTGLVTLPITYTLLRPSSDDDQLAPRIKTQHKVPHADVVESLRSAQKRKQRRTKRAIVAVAGWAVMAGMVYLIMTTAPTVLKLWNPYDILGISDVSTEPPKSSCTCGKLIIAPLVIEREANQVTLQEAIC